MVSDDGRAGLLGNIREYLVYERDEGKDHIFISPRAERKEEIKVEGKKVDVSGSMTDIIEEISVCKKCSLHKTRTKTVPGQGCLSPEIMFIGEAPGFDEDKAGEAFVDRAGQLLTRIIDAMGFTREQVFIGNILKCRPPDNRRPTPDEMETCLPFLRRQIALIQPKVIVALGATAVRGLLNLETGISKLRGKWLAFEGIDLMPTFHPAYLLRNQSAKHDVWRDMQDVLKRLGRTPPPRKKGRGGENDKV